MRTIHYLLILLCYAHIVKVMAQVVEFHGSLSKWSWAQCSTMLNIIIFQPILIKVVQSTTYHHYLSSKP